MQLTAAYRSLSRPSSAPDAKAFSVCSFSLELPFEQVSLFSGSRLALRLNCCVHTCSFFGKIVFLPFTEKPDFFGDFRLRVDFMFPLLCLSCMSHAFFRIHVSSYSVFNEHPPLLGFMNIECLHSVFIKTNKLTFLFPLSARSGLSPVGTGLKWTRTTDLALIRRAL